jgi:peptidoglycan hydrolase-like protein with peptidoglycan-binding domain
LFFQIDQDILKETINNYNAANRSKEFTMRALRRGDTGDPVADLQQMLIDAGYSVGRGGADGVFGAGTEQAVLQFQAAQGLDEDGLAGDTIAALEAALGEDAC